MPAYADNTTFTYDGDGGRVSKSSLRGAEGDEAISTTYIGSLYEVETGIGGTLLSRKHIFAGANRIATTTSSLRGNEVAEAISYFHTDHLGSSSVITDESGSVTRQYEYKPFGEIAQERIFNPDSEAPNFFYTGKRLDKDTGLYYYGARYYDPVLGRFIQPDTIVPDPFNPQSLNRYSYTDNNPINYTDPTGHFKWKKFWQTIVSVATTIISIAVPVLAPAMQLLNFAISAYTAAQTGNILGLAGSIVGGTIFGAIGKD